MENNPDKPVLRHAEILIWGVRFAFLLLLKLVFSRLSYYDQPAMGLGPVAYTCLDWTVTILLVLFVCAAWIRYSTRRWPRIPYPLLLEGACLTALFCLFAYLFREPLGGALVASADHAIHYVLGVLTLRDFLTHGFLKGWCSAIGTGIPLNELYPPGGNLLFCLFRGLTFYLPPEHSYNILVYLTYIAYVFCLYAVVRWYGGRTAALLLLPLLLCDSRRAIMFGWYQFFYSGMWANAIGVGLVFFTLHKFARAASGELNKRVFVVLSLSAAAAALFHALCLFLMVEWIALFLVLSFVFRSTHRSETTHLDKALSMLGLGLLLAFWWWGPFFTENEWIQPFGFWGRVNNEIGYDVLHASLFIETIPMLAAVSLLGIAWGLFQRNLYLRTSSLAALINILTGTEYFRYALHLDFLGNFYAHMQVVRLLAAAKITGMLLFSILLGRMLEPVFRKSWQALLERKESDSFDSWSGFYSRISREIVATLAGVLIFIPVLLVGTSVSNAVYRWGVLPSAHSFEILPDEPPYWKDVVKAFEFLFKKERLQNEYYDYSKPLVPFRVYSTTPWNPCLLVLQSPWGFVGPDYVPTILLRTRPYELTEDVLELADIKYAIGRVDQQVERITEMPHGKRIARFGVIEVYRNTNWNGWGYRVEGSASVRLVKNEPKRVQFRISKAEEGAILRVGISQFRKWKITIDEEPVEPLELSPTPEQPELHKFLSIPIRDGILNIRYQDEPIDYICRTVSVIAVLVTLALLFIPARLWNKYGKQDVFPTFRRKAGTAVLAVGAAVIVAWLCLLLVRPLYMQQDFLKYLGPWDDFVGKESWTPDGEHDLQWELFLSARDGKRIRTIQIEHVGPQTTEPTRSRWTTEAGPLWKVAVFDEIGNRIDKNGKPLDIPLDGARKLSIHAANCLDYLPRSPIPVRVDVILSDGTELKLYCPPREK